ncbi:MAG: sigma-70 family RNA polymerase sigma factor [Dehalococcoidales bacterium]|nr:sigma-70 family RNA polymerase sigma factor [Dehalococcoidales bacterium]
MARLVTTSAETAEQRFEALFHQHYCGIVSLLYRLLGTTEEAEELAQEAFLRLARDPVIWRPGDEPLPWLRRVALNLGYNALRSRHREMDRLQRNARLEEPLESALPSDPETSALRIEERAQVRQALARLSPRYQACLLLRHSGLSYREIASAIGVAPGSVGTLLARAEEAFRACYKELGYEM